MRKRSCGHQCLSAGGLPVSAALQRDKLSQTVTNAFRLGGCRSRSHAHLNLSATVVTNAFRLGGCRSPQGEGGRSPLATVTNAFRLGGCRSRTFSARYATLSVTNAFRLGGCRSQRDVHDGRREGGSPMPFGWGAAGLQIRAIVNSTNSFSVTNAFRLGGCRSPLGAAP